MGDLTQQVEIRSRDEFGKMANTFNHMITQLKQLIAKLNSELQERKRIGGKSFGKVKQRLSVVS